MGVVEQLPASKAPYSPPRPIDVSDEVRGFDCGKPPLNDFLRQRAIKNEGRASRTYVVLSQSGADAGGVVAYYTLAAGAVSHSEAPAKLKKNMPDPSPVIVLGRLAVDEKHQGKRLGQALLKEAMQRTLEASRQIGARALIVHAIDDDAVGFYVPYGFRTFGTNKLTLFLPVESIAKSL